METVNGRVWKKPYVLMRNTKAYQSVEAGRHVSWAPIARNERRRLGTQRRERIMDKTDHDSCRGFNSNWQNLSDMRYLTRHVTEARCA